MNDKKIETYEPMDPSESLPGWYGYPDSSPHSSDSFRVVPIVESRCDSTQALVLSAHGHYYAGWGSYQIGGATVQDGSAYSGISFWARSPGATDKGFVFSLNDATSAKDAPGCKNLTATRELSCQLDATSGLRQCSAANSAGAACASYDAATQQLQCTSGGVNVTCTELADGSEVSCVLPASCKVNAQNGSLSCSEGLLEPPADACGNPFSSAVLTTADWRYYRLPWSAFTQSPDARRQPNGIAPATLYGWTIDAPSWAEFELWVDDFAFYRDP